MSKHIDSSSLTVDTVKRTWRVTVDCPVGASPHLTAHRELIRTVDGEVIARDQHAGTVTRTLSDVASEKVTLGDGTVLTPAHIAEALASTIEIWETEDETLAPTPVVDDEEGQ